MSDWKKRKEPYCTGSKFDIKLFYSEGKSEILEFLDSLDAETLGKFDRIFERHCEGLLSDESKFRAIKGVKGAYEFKVKGRDKRLWRVFCFKRERVWILTHGSKKPMGDKLVIEQGKKCLEIQKEFLKMQGEDL